MKFIHVTNACSPVYSTMSSKSFRQLTELMMTEKVEDLFLPVLCFHFPVEASGGHKLKGFQTCFKGQPGFDLPWGAWGCAELWGLPQAGRASQVSHPSSRDVCPEKGVLFSEQRTAPRIGPLLQSRSFVVALSGSFVRKHCPLPPSPLHRDRRFSFVLWPP